MASRYGWTKAYCSDKLYWEEFWELVVLAANYSAEEKNAEFRMQYMVHADRKSARRWRDLPLPFPAVHREPVKGDTGGVKQLQVQAPHIQVTHLPVRHKPGAAVANQNTSKKD